MTWTTHSPAQTELLAQQLAQSLQPGDVLAYRGGLGAGKTAFTRGLAKGLGISQPVTSPTYTIVNEYLGGRLPLFHFDLYRLSGAEELFEIGWEEYLQRGGVCAVEWSEMADEALEAPIFVAIEADPQEPDVRHITITGGRIDADIGL